MWDRKFQIIYETSTSFLSGTFLSMLLPLKNETERITQIRVCAGNTWGTMIDSSKITLVKAVILKLVRLLSKRIFQEIFMKVGGGWLALEPERGTKRVIERRHCIPDNSNKRCFRSNILLFNKTHRISKCPSGTLTTLEIYRAVPSLC